MPPGLHLPLRRVSGTTLDVGSLDRTLRARYLADMHETVQRIVDRALIAVLDLPDPWRLLRSAQALGRGGIELLGLPATLDDLVEVAEELGEQGSLHLGLSHVSSSDQVSMAMMAGANFVLSSVYDEEMTRTARERGMVTIAGAATPTEVLAASRASDLVNVFPAESLGGPRYLASLVKLFPQIPLLVSGGVTVDTAPAYLEAGAAAVIVDQGLVPEGDDAVADEVVEARAQVMVEVCADAATSPLRQAALQRLQESTD